MKVRLNVKFYVAFIVLLCLSVLVWYGVYFINSNEILMEDDTPMDKGTKLIFTVIMSIVAISWSASSLTLLRQALLGYAFHMDKDGIQNTATAIMFFALIIIVPVKRIPYDAIQRTLDEGGMLTVRIDKERIQAASLIKLFVHKEYHFFSGFTSEKKENIKVALNDFMKH